ncbi:MAG: tripartite tricarboxylate transporter permease [Methanocellales archaeon]|nr:tripartite tricarboxylate transporter permease [Methanocellales archaeon]
MVSVLLGCILGTTTGLIPGLHVNNVALLLVAISPSLLAHGISPIYIVVIIIATSIAHTFLDFVPSIFLGAPEADTALAVLPGHRMLLEGRGIEAIRLSALGSAGSVVVALLLVVPLSMLFYHIYPILHQYMGWVLLTIVLLMIGSESGEMVEGQGSLAHLKYKGYAILVFLLSGVLGILAFVRDGLMDPILPMDAPSILFPLFSGLFGASMLSISLITRSVIPVQTGEEFGLPSRNIVRGVFTGGIAGSLVAWLPGVSSAVATVITRLPIREDDGDSAREFIVAVSGVNTANAIFTLIALYIIHRPRSGAMVAVNEILNPTAWNVSLVVLFLSVIVGVSIIAYFVTISIGERISKVLSRLNYQRISATVLMCLCVMVILTTGLFGLIIFTTATTIGMIPSYFNVRKSHAMGVLLFPLILFFFGIFRW